MAKRSTIQAFVVSWFPMYAEQAATILCLSRAHAARIADQLHADFAQYPSHDPLIHVERTEVRTTA